jgi:hypothetical protein
MSVNDITNVIPPDLRPWLRVLELAPDVADIFHSRKWDLEHALLFTLLHASDRKKVIGEGKDHEAVLRQCAWIVAHHEGGHDPYGRHAQEQLYYLERADEDDREYALRCYIVVGRDESGEEVDRDLEEIVTCPECIEFWRTAPQRRRAAEAARTI